MKAHLNFHVQISDGRENRFPCTARSQAGSTQGLFLLPKELEEDEATYAHLFDADQQVARAFGQRLFQALFDEERARLYRESLQQAAILGAGLRIMLSIAPPQLAALPWEFLYDQDIGDFVCLSTRTPLTRFLRLPAPLRAPAIAPPLRILMMAASPSDLPRLDVDREQADISQALGQLLSDEPDGLVELHWLHGKSWEALQEAMRQGPWHAFHFSGHGAFDESTQEGVVYLEHADGQPNAVPARQLAALVADHPTLRLAFLNICHGAHGSAQAAVSSTTDILVRRGLPAVLGMQGEISDRAAISLARTFYDTLAEAFPTDVALVEARKAIMWSIKDRQEWALPLLVARTPQGSAFRFVRDVIGYAGENRPSWISLLLQPGSLPAYRVRLATTFPELRAIHEDLPSPSFILADLDSGERIVTELRNLVSAEATYLIALTPSEPQLPRRQRLLELGALMVAEQPHNVPELRDLLRRAANLLLRRLQSVKRILVMGSDADGMADGVALGLPRGYEVWQIPEIGMLRGMIDDKSGESQYVLADPKSASQILRSVPDLVRKGAISVIAITPSVQTDTQRQELIGRGAVDVITLPRDYHSSRGLVQLLDNLRHNWCFHTYPGSIRVDAWVSDPEPRRNADITVLGRFEESGEPVPRKRMYTTWRYLSRPHEGRPVVTDKQGIARTTRQVGGNTTLGHPVVVEVSFRDSNDPDKTYEVTTHFTPGTGPDAG